MATIDDVAKLAGVSVATVSRVLNNNYTVGQKNRDKVLEAVQILNYQPNAFGRNLRRSETKMVLVVCTSVIEQAMNGINDTAKELGYDVILSYTHSNGKGNNSIKFLENGLVDGVIFLNMIFKDEELINISKQYPVVQCGEYVDIPNAYLVSTNDERAAYEMVNHLINTGKRRIGYIAYDAFGMNPYFSREREKGYKQALADNNIPFDPELIKSADRSYKSGVIAATRYLELKNRPDAVFCSRDNLAIACINTFETAGLAVPGDIAIAGFDNNEIAEMCSPALTTVAQSFYEMGCETMRMLIAQIKGEITVGRRVYINHKLVVRASTSGNNENNNMQHK
jgi:LacI family repressor for deo operon, udp, cdd, tsx, nupC, and nupG